jgi:carbonic anhydrase
MKRVIFIILCLVMIGVSPTLAASKDDTKKSSPVKIMKMLKDGNKRFYEGTSTHPHITKERLKQAGKEDQGDHAYATVISCSDSRVPVELIFDAGVMDLFVVRVAGNVCNVDQCGSIEYGLAHVHTPVLVVMGHSQCGAVDAVTQAVFGKGNALERNIPPMVANIQYAVTNAIKKFPDIKGDEIVPYAIEENVYQSIHDLYMKSPATRNLVKEGKVLVAGAIYNLGTGKIKWLPLEKSRKILKRVLKNPKRAMNAMAENKH